MARLTVTLLCAVLVYLTVADIPYIEPGQGCVYGIGVYQVGETFNSQCDTCTCLQDGTVSCDKSKGCCLYAGTRGETRRAELGESFNDGCNQCQCTKSRKNRGPWACTEMFCPCRYKNWESVWGYASSGASVPVYDPKGDEYSSGDYGCPKMCTCKAKKRGKREKVNCKREPCIYF